MSRTSRLRSRPARLKAREAAHDPANHPANKPLNRFLASPAQVKLNAIERTLDVVADRDAAFLLQRGIAMESEGRI